MIRLNLIWYDLIWFNLIYLIWYKMIWFNTLYCKMIYVHMRGGEHVCIYIYKTYMSHTFSTLESLRLTTLRLWPRYTKVVAVSKTRGILQEVVGQLTVYSLGCFIPRKHAGHRGSESVFFWSSSPKDHVLELWLQTCWPPLDSWPLYKETWF